MSTPDDDDRDNLSPGLCSVDGRQLLRFWVDSGAVVTTIPKGVAHDYPLQPTLESRNGVCYVAAGGQRLPDFGMRSLIVRPEGSSHQHRIKARVTDVRKALLSVHGLTSTGHRVIFDEDKSVIIHKASKVEVPMTPVGRGWKVDMQILPSGSPAFTSLSQMDFPRHPGQV
jgi:hypothetical protein